ncbi:MAG TPA: NAD(P)/FAD-dependent oxidoreductase [Afifellaceae bacterium]|nr:NAD(P)/FAD-dependent oxidoreductase [Afifellaceae bacterium]
MPSRQEFDSRYDVVIVGARCAGASTAMLLARAGVKVLVIDRQEYGTDRLSTHALMRAGVFLLDKWGLVPALTNARTPKVSRTTFHYGNQALGIDLKPEYGIGCLYAPRRFVLDRILVDAAAIAGAHIRHGVSFAGLLHGPDGRIAGAVLRSAGGEVVEVMADLVIGADGRQSTVARQVHAETYAEGRHASGYVYGYFHNMKGDGYHWYFGDGVAAGAIPTNGGQHCVFVGVPGDRFSKTFARNLEGGFVRTVLANSTGLCAALGKALRLGRLRGFAGAPGFMRQSFGPGWALVGDAGYFKDPLTAHGMTDALRDAMLLSSAVLAGEERAFAEYQATRDELSRSLFDVTDAIASFQWDTDEIGALHLQLSDAMKAETRHVAGLLPSVPMVA